MIEIDIIEQGLRSNFRRYMNEIGLGIEHDLT